MSKDLDKKTVKVREGRGPNPAEVTWCQQCGEGRRLPDPCKCEKEDG